LTEGGILTNFVFEPLRQRLEVVLWDTSMPQREQSFSDAERQLREFVHMKHRVNGVLVRILWDPLLDRR
jgi:hypothetical protein